MDPISSALKFLAPGMALKRARNRAALAAIEAHYSAASLGNRSTTWRAVRSDADSAAAGRGRLTAVARDMIRNTPFATRARQVITANVVGSGILPKVVCEDRAVAGALLGLIEAHLDTTAIDAAGRCNLYGLQQVACNAIVEAGEVLVRRRRREPGDGLPLPFQIEVIEADYLDESRDGPRPTGGLVRDGIEYDSIGRRTGYWLHFEHPGAAGRLRTRLDSRFVPASEVLHIYRQDRPGQMRGVSWFAPVAMSLQDLHDHQDAQLMRQKIAACFAAFRTTADAEPVGSDPAGLITLVPGRIQNLPPGEDIKFASPPPAEGYDEFTRNVLRAAAAGLGITYEALTGDLAGVNFTSGRMGRIEMNRNVEVWQHLMMVPLFCQPLARWFLEAWRLGAPQGWREPVQIKWVAPARTIVDPAREMAATVTKVRASLGSLSGAIREMGEDPERVFEEIARDNATLDLLKIASDADPRRISKAGNAQAPDALPDRETDDE